MTDNADGAETRQQQLRQLAYSLWEADGRPHGRHEEYWQRAVTHLDAAGVASVEDNAAPSGPGETKPRPGKVRAKSAGTRKAAGKSDTKPPTGTHGTGTNKSPRRKD